MKPSTIAITAVTIVAAVVLYVLFTREPDGRDVQQQPPAAGGTETVVPGEAPAPVETAAPGESPEPLQPAPSKTPAGSIDAAREAYDGGWLGERTRSLAQLKERYGPWMEYQAIIWATPPGGDQGTAYLSRYPELGLNCGMAYRGGSPKPFYDAGLNAYHENVFRSPYFFLKSRSKRPEGEYRAWSEIHDEYMAARDRKDLLERKPSLNDPEMWKLQEDFIRNESVGPFAGMARKPVAVNLRDEPSVTTSANPFDYDFSPVGLDAFREWLKDKYGTVEALNSEWETDFAGWADVTPFTTEEIRAREYRRVDSAGTMKLAPWADHREFNDVTFAVVTEKFVKYTQGIIPGAYVGLEGLQMPHAFGGYDYWKLIRAMNWAEPYDIRCSREITRSFNPHIPVVATGFETDGDKLATKLWYLALMGDRGIIIWPYDGNMNDRVINTKSPGYEITAIGSEVGRALRSLRSGAADLVATADQQVSPIAIYYSQASIRADWMLETREDGSTWLKRYSSYESKHNQKARAREALGKLLEDVGYQYNYVSYEQVARGELVNAGYKLLLAPRLHALSSKEAGEVRRFVENGGTLITDIYPGIMNENCTSADTGLRGVLGLPAAGKLLWKNRPESVDLPLGDAGTVKLNTFREPGAAYKETSFGKGKAIVTGADLFYAYESERLTASGGKIREYMTAVIRQAGIPDHGISVEQDGQGRPAAVETHFYRGVNCDIVGLNRNPVYLITEELKDLADKTGVAGPVRVTVKLPYAAYIYDAGRKGLLGRGTSAEVEIRPELPAVLALLPYEVTGIDARLAPVQGGIHVTGVIKTAEPVEKWALHALTLSVMQGGKELPLGALFAENGSFDGTVTVPLGITRGRKDFVLRDAASMKELCSTGELR
ncbi:MAG: beta-galactosidase trimerization domain-containing protein [Planctomycetes bacterium]|nr:beta-galactosidase trimerization domain-containing protein [Planctomycetota bacterium]